MNLLILSEPSFPRHPGGAGKSTHVLAAELARRGHRITILCECAEADAVEVVDGVTVHRLNTHALSAVAPKAREAATADYYLRYIEEKLEPARFDLVYDSGGFLSYFFLVARALKLRFGTPYLIHYRYLVAHHRSFQDRGASRPLSWSFVWMEKNLWETSQCAPARVADLVVCPSRFQAEFVEQHYRPVSGAVQVLPEPVAVSPPEPAAVAALRAELAPAGARLVFFGGRIDSELKNPKLVATAFARLLLKEPRARLALMVKSGGVPKAFRRVKKQVIALPWVKDPACLTLVLASMDVGLVPSTYESFGLMCAELLAVGTPVVASPVGAMSDMIEHGKNGFLLEGARGEAWVQQIAEHCQTLLQDPELEGELRTRARRSAAAYSVESVGAQAEALCELAIRSRGVGARAMVPPHFTPHDQAHYLRLLEERLGRAAVEPATRVLGGWQETVNERCANCSRGSLADGHLGVIQLGRFVRAWGKLSGQWPKLVASAVHPVCPLGLVQRDLLRRDG